MIKTGQIRKKYRKFIELKKKLSRKRLMNKYK